VAFSTTTFPRTGLQGRDSPDIGTSQVNSAAEDSPGSHYDRHPQESREQLKNQNPLPLHGELLHSGSQESAGALSFARSFASDLKKTAKSV
jgi:hypothetical protein